MAHLWMFLCLDCFHIVLFYHLPKQSFCTIYESMMGIKEEETYNQFQDFQNNS